MNSRVTQIIPAVLALAVIGFRYFSQWCIEITRACYGTMIDHIAFSVTNPLDSFTRFFIVIALILILIPKAIFKSWLKFAAWALPLAFLDIASTPVYGAMQGFGMMPSGPGRDDAARSDGQLFLIISLIIIVFGFIRARLEASGKRTEREIKSILKESWVVVTAIAGFAFAAFLLYPPFVRTISASITDFAGAVSLSLVTLGYGGYVAYRKNRAHEPLGWRLPLAFSLAGVTIVFLAVSFVLA